MKISRNGFPSEARLQTASGRKAAFASVARLNIENDGYRTPLFKRDEPRSVLRAWHNVLGVTLYDELENTESSKFGPYYHRPFHEWSQNLEAYYRYGNSDVDWKLARDSIHVSGDYVVSLLRRHFSKLSPITITAAVDSARRNTNLGLPRFTSNWRQAIVHEYAMRAEQLLDGKDVLYPFVLFRRVQPGGYWNDRSVKCPAKNRPVWGADHAETFAGLTILKPLLDALSRVDEYAHLRGDDYVDAEVRKLQQKYRFYISLDFQAADATFGPQLIAFGLSILHQLVDIPDSYTQLIWKYYCSGEVVTPQGVKSGTHGIASGVTFTNILETLVFKELTLSFLHEQGLHQGLDFKTLNNGDDGVIFSNTEIDIKSLAAYYAKFGLGLNESKTTQSDSTVNYLQRQWIRGSGNGGVMSTCRMLGRILFAERGISVEKEGMGVGEFWTLNTIMKLENCKHHPKFEEFVHFVALGDDLHLQRARDHLYESLHTIRGYATNEDSTSSESGLARFETVRVLGW